MPVMQFSISPPFSARSPADSLIYAIGDIHGCADLCDRLRSAIWEHAATRICARKVMVYLGDYVGRGPEVRRVIDMLSGSPLPGFETFFLRGNHEEQFLRMLDGDAEAGRHQLSYGGEQTLASYGISVPKKPEISDQEIAELSKEMGRRLPPDHAKFLRELRTSHREGDYFFVHAGIRPGTPISGQSPSDMMWIRNRFLYSDDDFGVVVVHGHTISEEPVIRRNRIGIDTGAYLTGRLTAAVFEKDACSFLQVSSV